MLMPYTTKLEVKRSQNSMGVPIGELSSLSIQMYGCITTVKILKFGTPQTIAKIVLKIEKFGVTLH